MQHSRKKTTGLQRSASECPARSARSRRDAALLMNYDRSCYCSWVTIGGTTPPHCFTHPLNSLTYMKRIAPSACTMGTMVMVCTTASLLPCNLRTKPCAGLLLPPVSRSDYLLYCRFPLVTTPALTEDLCLAVHSIQGPDQ